MQRVVIVDYHMGNLHSVKKRLKYLGVEPIISSESKVINTADKIILPGVGHFGKAMQNLRNLNLKDVLDETVLVQKRPILGICLGMQLMAKHSEEGNSTGLSWFNADVIRFNVSDTLKYKVPHTGWNQVSIKKESMLMKKIPDLSEFYFVHSYHFKCHHLPDVLNVTEFDYPFVSAVEKENIFGVQYHPEKSHEAGAQLLKNFVEL